MWHFQDGERLIVFGAGALDEVDQRLAPGFTLLTTARATAAAPAVAQRAGAVHEVPDGRVDEVGSALREAVGAPADGWLLALGGGRVIDVAKALAAAAEPQLKVAAVPTTLSAAEMTAFHRHLDGVAGKAGVRPALVLNDPALCASQPDAALAGSAGNAFAHAAEALATTMANPVTDAVATESARLIAGAWNAGGDPDREALALGALLSGWANGAALFGLHHVLAQTLARFTSAGHAPSNVILLPHTLRALAQRVPERFARLADIVGDDPSAVGEQLAARAGHTRLREVGVTAEQLATCADEAAVRPQLALTPPAASRDEILAIYEAAW